MVVPDRAPIKRLFDLLVCIPLAARDGRREIGMCALPAGEGGVGDIEEVGDVCLGQAVTAELARLIGEGGPIAVG
ncbi:MAG: hypothetical protein JWN66_4256 [Sphingomonas bacterium]|uniref:hypothetical protein n=1 Tax=Sphingomonas bacterium TaxID=1895847 RepID=UPI002628A648|nr:hypothetical protein [Sphingomonas bacterium]MDB5707140.1 hypothetical protein [Sphingomonas bacterium]